MRPLSRQPEAFGAQSSQTGASEPLGASQSLEHPTDVTEVFRKLAAHGGGEVSFDLALDLVLNELVQLARDATGATGAAIALERDGEMVCRATTGGNAPDLGVRVETTSGLTGSCLQTGETQLCSDTETDGRVDAEACRQLGVRSMLIAPVESGGRATGILEVFSSRADAFAAHDIDTVQGLARKIAESQKGITQEAALPEKPTKPSFAELLNAFPVEEKPGAENIPSSPASEEPAEHKRDLWTSVLVFLVILVAVVLGVVIGWRQAAKYRTSTAKSPSVSLERSADEPQNTSPTSQPVPSSSGSEQIAAQPKALPAANPSESGGLVITQNGKVIYRQVPAEQAPTARNSTEAGRAGLIHRVEPQYPEAAKTQGIQGTVILDVQVLGDGQVGDVQVVSGDPLLADAAVQAVKQWKYQPHSINGRPAESQARVTIRFSLPPG